MDAASLVASAPRAAAGLKQQLVGHVEERGPDAMSPAEQLKAIAQRVHALAERHEKRCRARPASRTCWARRAARAAARGSPYVAGSTCAGTASALSCARWSFAISR
jgi:hypothetical protein